MQKLLLTLAATAFLAADAAAQSTVISSFDNQVLPSTDTAYVNYSQPGTDVGFTDGAAYFPCVYDTGWGASYWSYGFAYSNKKDSVTSGYLNEYSAKTAIGYNGSANYAVAYGSYNTIRLLNGADRVQGMYVTNNTFAYNSMRDGDFVGKKFGGANGTDPDYFRGIVRAFRNGQQQSDSVVFYLADFRGAGTANDYILNTWQWVDLQSLGTADSIAVMLQSSDVGSFGINTPTYFALDDFTVMMPTSVARTAAPALVRLYPNPASHSISIRSLDADRIPAIEVFDALGRTMLRLQNGRPVHEIDITSWPAGSYNVRATGPAGSQSVQFVKQP